MENKTIREMSQEELLVLMEEKSKGLIQAQDTIDCAIAERIKITEAIDDLAKEKKEIELSILETDDKLPFKKELIRKEIQIKDEKKKLIPYKKTIHQCESTIKKLRLIYDRAKSRYFNNKLG